MKISTKITTGFAGLILLLAAILGYRMILMSQVQYVLRTLGATNFRASLVSLQMIQDLAQVDEFTRKTYVTGGDPDYVAQARLMRDSFRRGMEEIRGIALTPVEEEQVKSLATLWSRFVALPEVPVQEQDFQRQITLIEDLRLQTQKVIRVTREAISLQVETSAEEARRADRISLGTALLALAIGIIGAVWIVRSIARPLRKLTAGTRAVAAGEVTHQIQLESRDELAQLAADFNAMTIRLGELDQMKRDFVSHASHELKTPLASMQETVRLMLDGIPGALNGQQRRLLELNLQSSQRLSAMLRNLLDLSRMEAGVMEYAFEWNDLRELARAAASELEGMLREKSLKIELDLPEKSCVAQCDGGRIMQVITNLLGNAIKYSPAGAPVRIALHQVFALPEDMPNLWRVRMPERSSQNLYAVLSIADIGPGVPADERIKIFEKFHQVREPSSENGGAASAAGTISSRLRSSLATMNTGLGLTISRTIVEAHRGAIWVTENDAAASGSRGSIFHMLLPVDAKAPLIEPVDSAPI